MQDFKRLQVWQKAHAMTLLVYGLTRAFPREEVHGLTNQMRRASCSVGANIAEGACRERGREFARFLLMAMGSASELENHALLARDLSYLKRDDADQLAASIEEVKRMLATLIARVRASDTTRKGPSNVGQLPKTADRTTGLEAPPDSDSGTED